MRTFYKPENCNCILEVLDTTWSTFAFIAVCNSHAGGSAAVGYLKDKEINLSQGSFTDKDPLYAAKRLTVKELMTAEQIKNGKVEVV